jgi:hypothetical protein
MNTEAVVNRSLWDVTHLAGSKCRVLGDQACGTRERVAFRNSVQGLQLLPQDLRRVDLISLGNFPKYATDWEERYSVLVDDRTAKLEAIPVVDQTAFRFFQQPGVGKVSLFPVVLHCAIVPVGSIIVPKQFAVERSSPDLADRLDGMLDQGLEAFVEENYPAGKYSPIASWSNDGPNYFRVLTDPEGQILAILGSSGRETPLESEDPLTDALIYLQMGIIAISLAGFGRRFVVGVITRRAAKKAAASALAGFTATEKAVIAESKQILLSREMIQVRQAQRLGKEITTEIRGRWIQYEPELPWSGLTNWEKNGFTIGRQAFTSEEELTKTILHELYRLSTSVVRNTGGGGGNNAETKLAFEFAERALKAVFGGK